MEGCHAVDPVRLERFPRVVVGDVRAVLAVLAACLALAGVVPGATIARDVPDGVAATATRPSRQVAPTSCAASAPT